MTRGFYRRARMEKRMYDTRDKLVAAKRVAQEASQRVDALEEEVTALYQKVVLGEEAGGGETA